MILADPREDARHRRAHALAEQAAVLAHVGDLWAVLWPTPRVPAPSAPAPAGQHGGCDPRARYQAADAEQQHLLAKASLLLVQPGDRERILGVEPLEFAIGGAE